MTDLRSKFGNARWSLREIVVTGAMGLGSVLMLVGTIYGAWLRAQGVEALTALWPFYAAGALTILLGWINGDAACRHVDQG